MNKKLQSICPKLNAFNKVLIARSGKGLIKIIELKGSESDVRKFITDEIEFLNKNQIITNTIAISDKENDKPHQLFLLENDEGLIINSDNIYFFYGTCNILNKNVFDITNYDDPFEKVVKMINLTGLSTEIVKEIKTKILPDMTDEQFVNETVLFHYERFDDDMFHEDDFDWVLAFAKDDEEDIENEEAPKEEPSKEEAPKEEPSKKETPKEEPSKEEAPKEEAPKEEAPKEEPSKEEAPKPEAPKEEPSKEEVPKPEASTNEVPKPLEKMQNVQNEGKERLTEEEIKKNKELLANLKKSYKETIDFISQLRLSQWIPIKDRMSECVKNKEFNVQWCPLYLEKSKDLSSELYLRLYNLDKETKHFHESVIHQTIKLGCHNCAKEWVEDITFLKEGPHYIECPFCQAERGFEKQ